MCVWSTIGEAFGVYSQSKRYRVGSFKNKSNSRIFTSKEQNWGYEPSRKVKLHQQIHCSTHNNLWAYKLLKKNVAVEWTEECREAFERIKNYLSNPPVLVPPDPGRPLILYMSVLDNSFGCVLGQHDDTQKKERAIYYISKKFTVYEAKYTLLERTCCA